jgi:autotransporter-associated beta strand protein
MGALSGAGVVTNSGSAAILTMSNSTVASALFSGTIAGSLQVLKGGTSTEVLSGLHTYTGATTVAGGTLSVSGSISASPAVFVSDGATLGLGGTNSDRIGNAAPLNLGTLSGPGITRLSVDNAAASALATPFSETLGTLTLNSNTTLDLGTGVAGSLLNFANSSAASWTGTLSIYNWTGPVDTLTFGNSSSALTSTQLTQVQFFSDAGLSALGSAQISNLGVLTPVPEPSTWMLGGAMLGMLGLSRRSVRAARA